MACYFDSGNLSKQDGLVLGNLLSSTIAIHGLKLQESTMSNPRINCFATIERFDIDHNPDAGHFG